MKDLSTGWLTGSRPALPPQVVFHRITVPQHLHTCVIGKHLHTCGFAKHLHSSGKPQAWVKEWGWWWNIRALRVPLTVLCLLFMQKFNYTRVHTYTHREKSKGTVIKKGNTLVNQASQFILYFILFIHPSNIYHYSWYTNIATYCLIFVDVIFLASCASS